MSKCTFNNSMQGTPSNGSLKDLKVYHKDFETMVEAVSNFAAKYDADIVVNMTNYKEVQNVKD